MIHSFFILRKINQHFVKSIQAICIQYILQNKEWQLFLEIFLMQINLQK